MAHMHLSEGRHEPDYSVAQFGKRPVEYYDSLGVLGPWTLASQCVHLDAGEIQIMAERGCKASHMPVSNCEVGGGIAPAPEMLAAGVERGAGHRRLRQRHDGEHALGLSGAQGQAAGSGGDAGGHGLAHGHGRRG